MVKIINKFNIVLCVSLFTQQVHAESLNELFSEITSTNPTILSSLHGVNIAKENVKQASSSFYPTLTATASVYNTNTDTDKGNDTKVHPKSAGVSLNQTLFAGGKIYSGYNASKNQYKSTKALHNSTVQKTLNSFVSAYIGVLTAKEVLELQKKQVKLLQEQMNMTNSRFTQGEVTKTDVMQATARLAIANAEIIQASGNYRTSQTAVSNIIGKPVKIFEWPTINFELPTIYNEALNEATLNIHPNVVASLATLNSTKNNITVARSAHYPTINAVASYTDNNDTSNGNYNNGTIGVELSIPLFVGGKTLSTVRSSISSKEQALQNYEQTKRNITENLVDAIELYTTALATLNAFKESESAAKHAEEGVEKEQMLGERSVLELLDARQELLETRVNVAKGKGDVIIQAYNLLAAMGTLNTNSAKKTN